ncbi:hypothetical protein BUALT_Bualt09G0107400 [Buddleja alternifolia]|uniref:ubiquitinyl hydrolase 1 n=1 Tax=Buddleja alternifolia TaxID=168488 RepID=A0AAV6X0Z4_9LAMI|nr:hypothetical protein BUALT_Bualt09G0107400 [Buddleja alternifolia]
MTMVTPQPLDQQEGEEMRVPNSDLVEGPQPMEVPPADNAGTVENAEPQASRFTWTIENFSRLNMKRLYSDVFTVGNYKWRVLIFPKGNNVEYLSMYLDVADSATSPYGWNRYAQFSLAVVNHLHSKYTIKKDTQHQFNQRESDWGFTSFMPLSELYDPSKGYLVNDTCVVEADVAVHKKEDKEMLVLNSDLVEGPQPMEEEKEDKRRYKAQAHLYTIIKVARDEDLMEQIGKDIHFDLVDHDEVHNFRIQKQMPFNLFKEEVAKEFGIPVQFQRFWIWAKRQNHTYRPNRPLTPQEEAHPVGALREISNRGHNAELKLFLEVERGQDLHPVPPPQKNKKDILLFFKLYDPEKEELRYVGRLFVKNSGKPIEILPKLNHMAGFAPDEEIELFEEIKFEPSVMCERLDKRASFRFSQLEDGDIVCFQKRPPPESEEKIRFLDVPSFLEYVKNRQVVHFRALERPKEDEFSLELAKNNTYDDVVERVAQRLYLDDPSKIRLTAHNCYSQQPKPNTIKYRSVDHLLDMLVHYNQISDILYYEVLDIPLPELHCLKTLKVAFHHATKDEAVILNIRLPKQITIGDVLNEIKTKVELSHPSAELRLLEVFYHKIYKIFPPHEKIETINDQYFILRAEEIPEEEKNLGPNDRLIHVYHFTKESAQNQVQVMNFGEPFFLVIHEGETLTDVKVRIQKKLQVPDEEFSKWKFAFLSLGHPEYLDDSDVVSSRFQRGDVYGARGEQYLGLEHSDTTPKRAYAASQVNIFRLPLLICVF